MKILHKLYDFITFDSIPKIISIITALFLWFYVNILSIEKTYINIPVYPINTPAKTYIKYQQNLAVRLEIQSREDISQFIKQFEAVIDLSEAQLGTNNYPIILNNIPEGIHIQKTPESIQVIISEITAKTVPVSLSIESNANSQINVKYSITPKEITIYGSSDILSKIKFIKTDTLKEYSLSNIVSPFNTNLSLRLPNGVGSSDTSNVNIYVEIMHQPMKFTNQIILPINITDLKTGFSTKNLPGIELTAVSATESIEQLILATTVEVNAGKINTSGEFMLPVSISTPPDFKILNQPAEISIEIISNKNVQELVNPIIDIIMHNKD